MDTDITKQTADMEVADCFHALTLSMNFISKRLTTPLKHFLPYYTREDEPYVTVVRYPKALEAQL